MCIQHKTNTMLKNDVLTPLFFKCSSSSTKLNASPFREFKNIKNFNDVNLKISVSILPIVLDLIPRNPEAPHHKEVFFVNDRYYYLLYTDKDNVATCQNLQTGQKTIFHILKIVHVCLVLDAPEKNSILQLSLFV